MPARARLAQSMIGAAVCAMAAAGCKLAPPPDPNDPNDVEVMKIEVLQRNLKWAYGAFQERVEKGEITEERAKDLLAKEASRLLESVDMAKVRPFEAWRYGDVFRTAERWDLAKRAFEIAVNWARKHKSEDRRVNDSLRLAQCLAKLEDVPRALELARSTFDVPPQEKAPILMAMLYEIVPAAQGKGSDIELAKLLEDAIGQHQATIVDPASDAGKTFLAVKTHHLIQAWAKVVQLYEGADRMDLGRAARQRFAKMLSDQQRL